MIAAPYSVRDCVSNFLSVDRPSSFVLELEKQASAKEATLLKLARMCISSYETLCVQVVRAVQAVTDDEARPRKRDRAVSKGEIMPHGVCVRLTLAAGPRQALHAATAPAVHLMVEQSMFMDHWRGADGKVDFEVLPADVRQGGADEEELKKSVRTFMESKRTEIAKGVQNFVASAANRQAADTR